MISITTTAVVVVTFATTFRPGLALMGQQDLFCFQLKFLHFFTDLVESLFGVLVSERCHGCLVVVRVVMARMLNNWAIMIAGAVQAW